MAVFTSRDNVHDSKGASMIVEDAIQRVAVIRRVIDRSRSGLLADLQV